MTKISRLAIIAALIFAVQMPVLAEQASRVIPGSWIVELADEPTLNYRGSESAALERSGKTAARQLAATAPDVTGAGRFDADAREVRAYADYLDQRRQAVIDRASAELGRTLTPRAVYRHAFNGFAAEMSADEARALADVDGVTAVRPDMAYPLELDEGPSLIGASAFWNADSSDTNRGEGVVIGVIDSGINWEHVYFSDDTSDTGGYEYDNPFGEQLGECSKSSVECNDKLIGVYDFADEGTDGRDPEGEGHGTHVASTAAGNPWNFQLSEIEGTFNTSGVAPRANIISYKVCFTDHPDDEELDGKCVGSAISQALEQVIEDGVDVVNYSIGSDAPDPWANGLSFLNIRNAGIVFVTSAGNSGPDKGSISSPGNAPWTMSVGSVSHRRRIGNEAEVAGISDIFLQPGSGPELTSDITAPVIAADSVGDEMEGCSPFPGGAFDGAVAFIIRGGCVFETKVNNAADAGAEAVLVYNHEDGGGVLTMAGLEETDIPAAMMDNEQGKQVRTAIGAMVDPQAALLAGNRVILNSDWEDRVSGFSSRGPGVGAPDVMKPNVTAPGQDILAGFVPSGSNDPETAIGLLSGTSMASPHGAGAAAILRSRHPDWTPDMVISALETTANSAPVRVGQAPASMLDRGAGRLRVDLAANVGLYLPVTTEEFENADPSTGGEPGQLNLPGVMSSGCVGTCRFTRTVRAIESGSWSVSTEGDLDIVVEPGAFSLSAGEEQELTIDVSAGDVSAGTFGDGAVVLSSSDGLPTQRLAVGLQTMIAELPEKLSLNVDTNRGRSTLNFDEVGEMSDAVFPTSGLERPVRESFTVFQDGSPDDPYSGGGGTETFHVEVPEDSLMLYAEVVASDADDIDLFVGRDDNGDGIADESEEVCSSTSPNELEECAVSLPEAGTWWILVQNWEGSGSTGGDSVELDMVALAASGDPSLTVFGPGRHDSGPLEIPFYWDQPAMERDQRWLGAIGMSTTPDELANIGVIPVEITRSVGHDPLAGPLFADETLPVVLSGGAKHERLYFDVPPGTDAVSFEVSGDSSVQAQLKRIDFDEISGFAPGTPPADGSALDSGNVSESGLTLSASPVPGRWFVALDNTSGQEAAVEVSVSLEADTPVLSQRGLWSPRDRLIFQGIEWQMAGLGFIVWYTYDEDGLPVYYIAINEHDEESSVWTADLNRITNSTGVRQNPEVVGKVSLTMLEDNAMIYAWRMGGSHGSELYSPDAPQTCPEVDGEEVNYNGHWYSPDNAVGGTTMIVTENVQAQVRYYYDELGIGRWIYSDGEPLEEVLDLIDFRGFCPNCEEQEVEMETVGEYVRTFDSDSTGNETLEFISGDPLNHDIFIDVPVTKLSEPVPCQ